MTSNIPSPTTGSDIIYTLLNQSSGVSFMGPQIGVTGPHISQYQICQTASASTITCTLPGELSPNTLIIVAVSSQGGTGCPAVADNLSDSYTIDYQPSFTWECTTIAHTVQSTTTGGSLTVTFTNSPFAGHMIGAVSEVVGIDSTTPVLLTATTTALSCVGNVASWQPIITSGNSTVLAVAAGGQVFHGGEGTYVGISPYVTGPTGYLGGGNLSSALAVVMQHSGGVLTAGTYTPTATFYPSANGTCGGNPGLTYSLKPAVTTHYLQPTFRPIQFNDLQFFPSQYGNQFKFLTVASDGTFLWGLPNNQPSVFANLASCGPSAEGQSFPVTDSTTNTPGATITGGGSFHVSAYCNGTNWIVAAGTSGVAAQTCTSKFLKAVDAAATAGNCQTVTSSYVDTSIALTGSDINSGSHVVTVNGHSVAQIIYNSTATGQTSAITTTNMHTVSTSGSWRFSGDVNCTGSSAAATATLTLSWTDTSNTAQTQTVTATCTTLGSSSLGQITYSFRAKSGTNISWAVSIANTPTYDVDVALESVNGVL
jgi:hypothetical protein